MILGEYHHSSPGTEALDQTSPKFCQPLQSPAALPRRSLLRAARGRAPRLRFHYSAREPTGAAKGCGASRVPRGGRPALAPCISALCLWELRPLRTSRAAPVARRGPSLAGWWLDREATAEGPKGEGDGARSTGRTFRLRAERATY